MTVNDNAGPENQPRTDATPDARGVSFAVDLLSTEDLMARLLASASPEAYLASTPTEERSLPQYLDDLLQQNGVTKSQVIRSSGLNPTFAYQIFAGTRHVGRDNAIKLAYGLRCNLRQTQRLLRLAGHSELYVKIPRDAVIAYCMQNGATLAQTDETLLRLGQDPLSAPDGIK